MQMNIKFTPLYWSEDTEKRSEMIKEWKCSRFLVCGRKGSPNRSRVSVESLRLCRKYYSLPTFMLIADIRCTDCRSLSG